MALDGVYCNRYLMQRPVHSDSPRLGNKITSELELKAHVMICDVQPVILLDPRWCMIDGPFFVSKGAPLKEVGYALWIHIPSEKVMCSTDVIRLGGRRFCRWIPAVRQVVR